MARLWSSCPVETEVEWQY